MASRRRVGGAAVAGPATQRWKKAQEWLLMVTGPPNCALRARMSWVGALQAVVVILGAVQPH